MSEKLIFCEDPGAWVGADASGLDHEWRTEIYGAENQAENSHQEGENE